MSNFLLCPPFLDPADLERQRPRRVEPAKQEKKIPMVSSSSRYSIPWPLTSPNRIKRKDSTSLSVTFEGQMGPIFVRVSDNSNKSKKT